MDEKSKEQLFRQALADHAAKAVPESRDVWPAIYQRLHQRQRNVTLNLTAAATPPLRWNFVALATVMLLFLGILSFALPATLGQYMPDHTLISPTRTYAATYEATYQATAIVRTSTPLPGSSHANFTNQPPLAAAELAAQPLGEDGLPTPLPPLASR